MSYKLILCSLTLYVIKGLTHFRSMFPVYTPWKYYKTSISLIFPEGIEKEIDLKWEKLYITLWSSYMEQFMYYLFGRFELVY